MLPGTPADKDIGIRSIHVTAWVCVNVSFSFKSNVSGFFIVEEQYVRVSGTKIKGMYRQTHKDRCLPSRFCTQGSPVLLECSMWSTLPFNIKKTPIIYVSVECVSFKTIWNKDDTTHLTQWLLFYLEYKKDSQLQPAIIIIPIIFNNCIRVHSMSCYNIFIYSPAGSILIVSVLCFYKQCRFSSLRCWCLFAERKFPREELLVRACSNVAFQ